MFKLHIKLNADVEQDSTAYTCNLMENFMTII